MNKIFLLILFTSFSLTSFSQNLTLTDIKYLFEHNVENCDSYLAKKSFYFMESKDAKLGEPCSSTNWAYKRNSSNNRAQAFIIKNCDGANEGFIFFQFADKNIFESIKSVCKMQGYKFVNKRTNVYGTVWFTFESKNYKIEFGSSLDDVSNENVYIITFEKTK